VADVKAGGGQKKWRHVARLCLMPASISHTVSDSEGEVDTDLPSSTVPLG